MNIPILKNIDRNYELQTLNICDVTLTGGGGGEVKVKGLGYKRVRTVFKVTIEINGEKGRAKGVQLK